MNEVDIILSINSIFDQYGKNGKIMASDILTGIPTRTIRKTLVIAKLDISGSREEVINRLLNYYFEESS